MNLMAAVAASLLGLAAILRLVLTALGLRATSKLTRLGEVEVAPPAVWPRVSMVVPACNEAKTLGRALESKLNQNYPDLEVVVVDDRSTDDTGAVADRVAAGDPRLRVLHLTDLPEGWLGKVHALDEGMKVASGDWVVLSDADVILAPGTLRQAIGLSEARGLDFLTILPEFLPVSLPVDATLADLMRALLPILQPDLVESPRTGLGVGGGAFMMVRKTAYSRTRGFEHLRLEVVDDMAFGQMMKASGARCSVASGKGAVQLAFYTSLADFARGSEKAFASVGRCSLPRFLLFAGALVLLNLAPLGLALVPAFPAWLRWSGLLLAALDLSGSALMLRAIGGRMLPALLAPLGTLILAGLFVRSAALAWSRGGIMWRGTLYRTADLRAGMRYRLPWG